MSCILEDKIPSEILSNPLMKSFLEKKENIELVQKAFTEPNKKNKDNLDKTFKSFYYNVRLISYFSKIIYFKSVSFDKKLRLENNRFPIILDQPIGDGDLSLLDSLANTQNQLIIQYGELDEYIENPKIYNALKKLTERQKEILFYAYIQEMKDVEIAKKLGVSQQAVSKTRQVALKKLRRVIQNNE